MVWLGLPLLGWMRPQLVRSEPPMFVGTLFPDILERVATFGTRTSDQRANDQSNKYDEDDEI